MIVFARGVQIMYVAKEDSEDVLELGAVEAAALRAQGGFDDATLVWVEGMDEWGPYGDGGWKPYV